MARLSEESKLAQIIKEKTGGKGVGFYHPEEFKLTVSWLDATENDAKTLLLHLQSYIDRAGLWRSFEKIMIHR